MLKKKKEENLIITQGTQNTLKKNFAYLENAEEVCNYLFQIIQRNTETFELMM